MNRAGIFSWSGISDFKIPDKKLKNGYERSRMFMEGMCYRKLGFNGDTHAYGEVCSPAQRLEASHYLGRNLFISRHDYVG